MLSYFRLAGQQIFLMTLPVVVHLAVNIGLLCQCLIAAAIALVWFYPLMNHAASLANPARTIVSWLVVIEDSIGSFNNFFWADL
jgi:hypothetical protein